MTQPRSTTSQADALGALLASLKARLQAVELLAHTPCTGGGGGTGLGIIVCTSATRPGAPAQGQVIYETDTDSLLVWNGAAWVAFADEQLLTLDTANGRIGVNDTTPSFALDVTGDIRATGTIYADGTIVFEGIADANETTLSVINPTADRTVNLPNASGNIALTSATDGTITLGTDTAGAFVAGVSGGTGIVVTGSGGEASTPAVAVDSTVAIKGSIALGTDTTGNYVAGVTNGTGIAVSGTPGEGWSPTVAVDSTVAIKGSIALGTDTTGNYVAGVTNGTGITVTGTPGEGWSPTVAVDSTVAIKGSIALGTDTTGDYVANLVAGTGISITGGGGEGSTPTITNTGTPAYRGAKAYRSTNLALVNNTFTVITWNAQEYDTDAFFAPTSTNIVVPAGLAGYYLLQGSLEYAANATGLRFIRIFVNGAGITYTFGGNATAVFGQVVNVSATLYLAVGDIVTLEGYQNSGGNLNVLGGAAPTRSWLQVSFLGA